MKFTFKKNDPRDMNGHSAYSEEHGYGMHPRNITTATPCFNMIWHPAFDLDLVLFTNRSDSDSHFLIL